MLRFSHYLPLTVHITDYHWDRHLYFVIRSYHAQTMTHTPPSDDSVLILRLVVLIVTVSPSPQSKDEENEKLHKLREYARDFRRQHTTDAEQFDWDSDDGDYGLAIGCLVVT
jgi:hypothetical protein